MYPIHTPLTAMVSTQKWPIFFNFPVDYFGIGAFIFIGIRVLMILIPNSEVFLVQKINRSKAEKFNPFLTRQVLPFSYIYGINRTEKHCVYIGAKLGGYIPVV